MELGWRKTWEDGDEDYSYRDATGRHLGRAYLSPQNQWRWFFGGSSGMTQSRREALLAVELAYERSESSRRISDHEGCGQSDYRGN